MKQSVSEELGPGARWFAIHTKPRQEQIAELHLNNQQFRVFLPKLSVQKRKLHKIVEQTEPYFPRYLFVQFDEFKDDWGCIRSTRGVSGLVQFNGRPQAIPESFMLALFSNQNSDGLQIVKQHTWKPGENVDIEDGPFSGYRCIFEAVKSSDRVSVFLNVIGKQTRAVLRKQDLAIPQPA